MPSLRTPSLRLGLSFLASLLLHGLPLAGANLWQRSVMRLPPLQVTLPALVDAEPAEDLLKNTLSDEEIVAPPRPHTAETTTPARSAAARPIAVARRKLAAQVFYPAEAVAAGWEGEVRLLLTLDGAGRIVEVAVAAGSGHAVLDRAAERAAWALGRLDGIAQRELLLPVEFRLR